MKAAAYIRVSISRQDSDNQLPAIRQWCESNDFELTEIYQETESAWRQVNGELTLIPVAVYQSR